MCKRNIPRSRRSFTSRGNVSLLRCSVRIATAFLWASTAVDAAQIHRVYSSADTAFAINSVQPTINTQSSGGGSVSRPLILNGRLVETAAGGEESDYVVRLQDDGIVQYAARVTSSETGDGRFLVDPNGDLVYVLEQEAGADNPESLYLRAIFDAQTLAPIRQIQIRGLDLQTYAVEWQTKDGAADKIWLHNKEDPANGKVTVMQLPTDGIDATPSSLTPDWSFTLQDPSGSAGSISLVRAFYNDDLVTWRSTATISGSLEDVTYDVYFSDQDGTLREQQRFHGSFMDAAPGVSTIPLRPNFTTNLGRLKPVIKNEFAFGSGTPAAHILLWSSEEGLLWAGKIEGVNLYPSIGVGSIPEFGAFYGQRGDGTPVFVSLEFFGGSPNPYDFSQEILAGAFELPLSQRGLFPDTAVRPVDGNETISYKNYEATAQGTLFDSLTGESKVFIFRYLADLTAGELFEMKTNFPGSSRLYDFGAGRDFAVLTGDAEGERFIFSEVRYDLGTNPGCQILEARPESPLEITNQLTVEDLADQNPYEMVEDNLSLASVAPPDVLTDVTFSTTDTVSLSDLSLQDNALCLPAASAGSGASAFQVREFTPGTGEVFTVRFPIEPGHQYRIEHCPSLNQPFRTLDPLQMQGASPASWQFPNSSGIAEVPLDPEQLEYEDGAPPTFDTSAQAFFIRVVKGPL